MKPMLQKCIFNKFNVGRAGEGLDTLVHCMIKTRTPDLKCLKWMYGPLYRQEKRLNLDNLESLSKSKYPHSPSLLPLLRPPPPYAGPAPPLLLRTVGGPDLIPTLPMTLFSLAPQSGTAAAIDMARASIFRFSHS